MAYIIHRKIRDAIYVYEVTSYRDKDGRPRNKQRCLGKLDKDGILITKKRKLPQQITVSRKIETKFNLIDA